MSHYMPRPNGCHVTCQTACTSSLSGDRGKPFSRTIKIMKTNKQKSD